MARGGLGLGGIVIIGAALYYTGAGSWLWKGVSHLDQSCYGMLSEIGTSMGTPICAGVSRGITALSQAGEVLSEKVGSLRQQFGSHVESTAHMSGIGSLGNWASSSEALQRMMEQGPQMRIGSNLRQQFQQAIDSYSIGQGYLAGGADSVGQAIPWLRQGAAQPNGYGMMSQLALGNLYSTGRGAISADPMQAAQSYQQAKASLNLLMASNAPEAQQMLQSLGSTPQQLSQDIDQALAQLKSMKK